MNTIYDILNKAVDVFSERGTLTKKDGTKLEIRIAPEGRDSETLNGEYVSALNVSTFSVAIDDLTIGDKTRYPEDGDVIEGQFGAPTTQRWRVIKDASSGRAWEWRWGRPGERIVFQAMRITEKGER